jgi:DNA-binding NarL/FixJ family response regulator
MTDAPQSIVVADDHPLVLSGLRSLIAADPSLRIVAVCEDGEAALQAIRDHAPAIAVLDLNMPKRDGLAIIGAVAVEQRSTRIVLLAAAIADGDLYLAVERGVYGVVLKDAAPDTLMDCLHSVAVGHRWLPAELVDAALDREVARRRGAEAVAALLTSRERQIALLVGDGRSNKDIARDLNLSEGTVKIHLHHIFHKLEVTTRTGLNGVISRFRDRLVRPGDSGAAHAQDTSGTGIRTPRLGA